VEKLIIEAVDFLAKNKIDLLVLACHTATKILNKSLRSRYNFPIIGMKSGIRKNISLQTNNKIVICGTDLSIKKWESQLKKTHPDASYLSLQRLVVYAEKFDFESQSLFKYLYKRLACIDWNNYNSILLGCTHFPFFKDQIKSILPNHVEVIDGSVITARQIQLFTQMQELSIDNTIDFVVSKKKVFNNVMLKYLNVLEQNHSLVTCQ